MDLGGASEFIIETSFFVTDYCGLQQAVNTPKKVGFRFSLPARYLESAPRCARASSPAFAMKCGGAHDSIMRVSRLVVEWDGTFFFNLCLSECGLANTCSQDFYKYQICGADQPSDVVRQACEMRELRGEGHPLGAATDAGCCSSHPSTSTQCAASTLPLQPTPATATPTPIPASTNTRFCARPSF